jgi:hypothetical protein
MAEATIANADQQNVIEVSEVIQPNIEKVAAYRPMKM